MKLKTWAIFALCTSLATVGSASPRKTQLTPIERERLRYSLESIFNDVDLLIKNQASERADLKREEKELEMFKVLERIPLARTKTDETLKPALAIEARTRALIIQSFDVKKPGKLRQPMPKEVYADLGNRFRLTDPQLVEEIRFVARVDGKAEDVGAWIASWQQEAARFAEPDGEPVKLSSKGRGLWEVRGRAYRFRDIAYPRIKARNPMELLPTWAKSSPRAFAEKEPHLWQLASRARELIPRSPGAFERRGRFMLASQRMEFYIKKTEGEVTPNPRMRAGIRGK